MIAPWIWMLIASAIALQIAVFCTTIYLHRAISHRAVTLHPLSDFAFRFGLWLTTGIIAKEWVAIHRKHHAYTDTEDDPHSPLVMGFWKVQLGNLFLYIKESRNKETIEKFTKDMHDDVWDRFIFNWGKTGLVVGTLLLALCLQSFWLGLSAMLLQGFFYMFVLSSSINGLCHWKGYKNFDNSATNIRSLALVTGGEGLHNNHHGQPSNAKFSSKASEFDPAWVVIRTLQALGLATPGKATS